MLENKELKYILTTDDGKMIAGYTSIDDAQVDAEDICKDKKAKKYHIYELTNSLSLAETVLQKTYALKTTYPLPEPKEPEKEKETEKSEEKKE